VGPLDEISRIGLDADELKVAKLEKIASLLHSAAETKKIEAEGRRLDLEAANIRRAERDEKTKFWVPASAPLITALAVAAGLWIQVYQVNRNSALQRASNDAAQFSEAVKMAGSDNILQSVAGATLIDNFLKSDDYKDQARQVELGVLSTSRHSDTFKLFFARISGNVSWDNYQDIVHITQSISEIWLSNYYRLSELSSNKKPDSSATKEIRRLENENDQVLKEITLANATLVQLLQSGHDTGITPDLTGILFSNSDLSGVDLTGAVITGTQFENCILSGAMLAGIEKFRGSDWSGTAWWRANKIDSKLLRFLEDKSQYSPDHTYFGDATRNMQEYQQEIHRLEANSH
jgi:hypothetical protein